MLTRLYQIYLYLVYNNFATLDDLSDLFNVNRKTIMRWISKLRQSGLVSIKRTNRGYFVEGYREWDESFAAQAPVPITSYKAKKEEFYRWKEEMEKQGTIPSVKDVAKRFGVTEKTAKRWLQSEKSHFATLNGSHASNVRLAIAARKELGLREKGQQMEKSHFRELSNAQERSHARKSPIQRRGSSPAHAEKPHVREKSHSDTYTDHISIQRNAISPAGMADGTFPRMTINGKLADLRKAAFWIRENVDAVEFIQNMGVMLYRPRGGSREWAGHCPLHDDRTPSFYVNEQNGFWYCHACGIGGDVVELVRQKYGLRFGEAVRWVLSRLSFQPHHNAVVQVADVVEEEKPAAEETESGREVPIMGEEKGTLDMESVKLNAATYLVKRRGIHPDTIKEYRLGVTESEEIAIPLMDRNSQRTGTLYRAIGVGTGRYRQEGNAVLFGVPQALRRMRETGQDTLYVVEGPFDAMSIHQEGFPAVAIMGSALSARQVEEIRKAFGQVRIVLIPDNDQTGWKAVGQNRKMLQKAGFDVKVNRLPHGKDVNEYLAEKFRRRYLSNPRDDYTENTENKTA